MRRLTLTSLPIMLALAIACGDSNEGSTGPSPTTTTSTPPVARREFTLRAADCFFSWSRPLVTLAASDEFSVRFKPTAIPEQRSGDWSNVVEVWLDGGDDVGPNSLALVLVWQPNSEWAIDFFRDGFGTTGQLETISVGGRFREVTVLRANGVTEWLLDGVSVLQFPDTKPQRVVYTRVVGAEALFQYEEDSASTLRAHSTPLSDINCMLDAQAGCAGLRFTSTRRR